MGKRLATKKAAKRLLTGGAPGAALSASRAAAPVRRPPNRDKTPAVAEADAVLRRALERRAAEHLNRLAEMRDARDLADAGKGQREIAEALLTTQPRVHRLLKAAQVADVGAVSAEEMIWRATVGEIDRAALIEKLKSFPYTYKEHAPEPFDGAVTGSWDQVRAAALLGFLSRSEYEEVRDAVQPPA